MKRQIIIALLMLTALVSQAQELTGTWVSVSVKGFCYEQGKRVELDDTRMTEASEWYTVMTFSEDGTFKGCEYGQGKVLYQYTGKYSTDGNQLTITSDRAKRGEVSTFAIKDEQLTLVRKGTDREGFEYSLRSVFQRRK